MKLPSDAEQAYRESLAYNPHFAQSRLNLARLLEAKGSLSDARREMDLFRADPDAPETIEARKIMAKSAAGNKEN